MGFFEKLKASLTRTRGGAAGKLTGLFGRFSKEGEQFFEELEETLIMADVGVNTAMCATDDLRDVVKRDKLREPAEVKAAFEKILCDILTKNAAEENLSGHPLVILVIGVNGVGKTTTIGKLAAQYSAQGKRVLLCAADTFRAAAADQLEIWANRAGVPLIRQSEGSDPASVVFDACSAAKARGVDVLICDTAGRLHNKVNLMSELAKIDRVIARELPQAARETLLVIDATTGQNGLEQAKQFDNAAKLTGVVLTKLDGTAKGGIVIAISDTLKVPVKYVGVGEKIDDLMPFDPNDFVRALFDNGEGQSE